MKNIIMAVVMLFAINSTFAQNIKYVVFTSKDWNEQNQGVVRYNKTTPERYSARSSFYVGFDRGDGDRFSVGYTYREHKNPDETSSIYDPHMTTVEKPLSFLTTITYDDWDEISSSHLTREFMLQKEVEYESYDKLYFIDRNDFTSTTLNVMEVMPDDNIPQRY